MSFSDTDEHELMRATVGKLAASFGHRYYVERARAGEPPTELWEALSEGGFVGVNLPAEHGGGGMGITELAIVEEELAAAGCPLLSLVVSPALVAPLIDRFGTPEQRARWLPPMASGAVRVAFAMTEPDAGSNSHNLRTVAERDGDGWRLRGTKHYISAVDESAAVLVVARTSTDERTGRGRLSTFLVDTDAPGLDCQPLPVEIVAPERQFTLFLDDVVVADERMVGVEGDGLRQLFHGLNPERVLSAAVCCGLGRYALDKAVGYARQRVVWHQPIGAHQGLAHPLADAKVQLELARLMNRKAAHLIDVGGDAAEAANMAKYAAAEAVLACLDRAIQVHGGHGLSSEYGLADLWHLARLYRIAPVSREMILNDLAQTTLGLPRSY